MFASGYPHCVQTQRAHSPRGCIRPTFLSNAIPQYTSRFCSETILRGHQYWALPLLDIFNRIDVPLFVSSAGHFYIFILPTFRAGILTRSQYLARQPTFILYLHSINPFSVSIPILQPPSIHPSILPPSAKQQSTHLLSIPNAHPQHLTIYSPYPPSVILSSSSVYP